METYSGLPMSSNHELFAKDFLESYLQLGLGSMPKSDIDALVMYLIDKYGLNEFGPMAAFSNQDVSEILRTPLSRVKRLRYEAALKFGGHIEAQAMGRLLAALASATLEPEGEKICLIIEDTLAKNWLQGKLKSYRQIFDHSFNTEIIKVSADGLFQVLEKIFDKNQLNEFKKGYENSKNIKDSLERAKAFHELAKSFAQGAAQAAGAGVVTIFQKSLGLG